MEAELIAHLRRRLSAPSWVKLGLGDDAAVLDASHVLGAFGRAKSRPGDLVVTTDLISDQVDFHLATADPRRIGRKALAVNLSDLAAMAAKPLAAFVALLLPRAGGLGLAKELYEGMIPLAQAYDVAIAGGDTNTWEGPLAISVTLLGVTTPRGPLTRRGARPGDQILVTGTLGGSILGRHFDFEPRVREAMSLHERYRLHAGMDISDGLSLDLSRLCAESGVGAELNLDAIPIADDARTLAAQLAGDATPLDHALSDGEDFELLLTAEAAEAERILRDQPLTSACGVAAAARGSAADHEAERGRGGPFAVEIHAIGAIIDQPGLWRKTDDGRAPLAPRGWQH